MEDKIKTAKNIGPDNKGHFVKINGHCWDVKFVNSEDEYLKGKRLGWTDTYNRVIRIDKSLDNESIKIVLIHELTHAILDSQGRGRQDNFSQEDVADFVSWNLDELSRLLEELYKCGQ